MVVFCRDFFSMKEKWCQLWKINRLFFWWICGCSKAWQFSGWCVTHVTHTIARESKRPLSLSWCTTCLYQLQVVKPIWTSKMMILKQIIPLIPTKYPSIRFIACHRPRCHHNLALSTAQSEHWYESTPTAPTCAKASGAGQSLTSVCWTTTLIFSRPTTGISNHASCIYRKTTRRFAVARVTP